MTNNERAALIEIARLYRDRQIGELLRDLQSVAMDTGGRTKMVLTLQGTLAEMKALSFISDYDAGVFGQLEKMLDERAAIVGRINEKIKAIDKMVDMTVTEDGRDS